MKVPHDIEAEESVLGAILLSGDPSAALLDAGLRPEHFYRQSYGAIFEAVISLSDKGDPIDRLTVGIEAKRRRLRIPAGEIDALAAAPPVAGNSAAYARRIVECASLRTKQQAARRILEAVETGDMAAIAEAEGILGETVDPRASLSPEQWRDQIVGSLRSGAGRAAWPWPLQRLNDLSGGGMRRAQVTTIIAWSKVGKSVFADGCLIHAAKAGARCHLYINEMSAEERGMRIAANLADVDYDALNSGHVTPAQLAQVEAGLADMPFGVTECAGWTAEEVQRDIIRNGWDVPCVDILHEFDYQSADDLKRIASGFARTAKRTHSHILLTAHLNEARAFDGELPHPVVRDILGSGHIKRASDFVISVHRRHDEDGRMHNDGEVRFLLGRSVKQGGAKVVFKGDRMRFDAA